MTSNNKDHLGIRVAACLASTIDGRLAHPQIPVLGSKSDRHRLETLRTQADVLLYGAGTARADSRRRIEFRYPELSRPALSRLGFPVPPIAVLCRDLTFDFASPFWTTPTRKVLLHVQPGPDMENDVADLSCLPSDVDYKPITPAEATQGNSSGNAAMDNVLGVLVRWVAESGDLATQPGSTEPGHGPVRVLCEGGGTLVAALLEADLLDELFLTLTGWIAGNDEVAPLAVGGTLGPISGARHLVLESGTVVNCTSEVFLRYRREGRPAWPITEQQ